ncbi:MAG: sigma-54-dependent transcriptional regulator [Planctomycetota bacterium]|jgi:DNA-binding NtrC family response regulator
MDFQTANKTETDRQGRIPQKDDTANVLIIDNDSQTVRSVLEILARKGIRGHVVTNEKDALDFLDKGNCDLAFIGDNLPREQQAKPGTNEMSPDGRKAGRGCVPPCGLKSSLRLLRRIKAESPELPVIMMGEPYFKDSAGNRSQDDDPARHYHQAVAAAVNAIREGCYDFMVKPVSRDKIETLLDACLPNHNLHTVTSAQEDTHLLYQVVGRSSKLTQTVDMAKRIAPTSAPVLIIGESGTGKELISHLVHHNSRRAQGAYLRVNCAALNDSLLESELFGHEKGAFTGAHAQRKGRFEMAHGGTILLDEITETPPKFQAKLLRALEQQDFERVGGNENVKVNVRIISTTNKYLLQEVREGRFRQDLYYRLSGVRLYICPLRERKEDLPDLVWHFVNLYARETPRRITQLDAAMMEIFARYRWPGNVRELRNVVRTSLILGSGSTLSLADASWLLHFDGMPSRNSLVEWETDGLEPYTEVARNNGIESSPAETVTAGSGLAGMPLAHVERRAILDTLRQTAGNQTKAAKVLGISDRTLRDKIRRYRQEGCVQSAAGL